MTKRATVTVVIEGDDLYSPYGSSSTPNIVNLSLTEKCSTDIEVARLLKRLALMVHPNVDKP